MHITFNGVRLFIQTKISKYLLELIERIAYSVDLTRSLVSSGLVGSTLFAKKIPACSLNYMVTCVCIRNSINSRVLVSSIYQLKYHFSHEQTGIDNPFWKPMKLVQCLLKKTTTFFFPITHELFLKWNLLKSWESPFWVCINKAVCQTDWKFMSSSLSLLYFLIELKIKKVLCDFRVI